MRELMNPINTPDELFHGGNPANGDACTVVTAQWLNDIQAAVRSNQNELLSILQTAVIDADSDKRDQVLEALGKLFIRRSSGIGYYATVPTEQTEPIVYVPSFGLMHWLESGGVYRSVDCGSIILHPSATPRVGTIKANGATLSKTEYAGLWSWAQANGVVVANASWSAGAAFYGDVDSSLFRIPDLRSEFFRAVDDGRNIDMNRTVGSGQTGSSLRSFACNSGSSGPGIIWGELDFDQISTSPTKFYATLTSTNNTVAMQSGIVRPRNVALLACIKL